ncbi:MAG: GNAT family N-acetyltransferase [Candidatus Eisenbacteria bacterium]|nr:GNAT family N-acetyltransferase [Candidatus Eisenbacteria bacterium]
MRKRPFQRDSDLELLQNFNAEAVAATDSLGYVHPGDIPHRLYSGNKLYDPSEVMTLWEDEKGVAAWVLVSPRFKGFDAQVRPDLRGGELEWEVLRHSTNETKALKAKYAIEGDEILADAFRGDDIRHEILLELGWKPAGEPDYVINRATLEELEEPVFPDGYSVRSPTGVEEAAALAEVHSASFGSTWDEVLYRKLMESPGYAPEREFVVVAPGGGFAAFTVTWHDHRNRMGLFEPVGTHKDHRRLGLGKQLIRYGMKRMAKEGMTSAIVATFVSNKGAQGLYEGCGFAPWYELDPFTMPA